ncbi:MAG: hypothetical protein HGA54_05945 [Actinobacteria bacterium]|nr:hypothetical protein [Actinomycetota bacterium]
MNDPRSIRKKHDRTTRAAVWVARLVVCAVFLVNVDCAAGFLTSPELYAPGFELSGIEGRMAVQGLGVAFLMWNATYPFVIMNPCCQMTLFFVVLVQQFIGLIGESFLLWSLPAGHESIASTITRFIQFDALGLVLMAAAFALLMFTQRDEVVTG